MSTPTALTPLFVESLPDRYVYSHYPVEDWEEALMGIWSQVTIRWSSFSLSPDVFFPYVASRIPLEKSLHNLSTALDWEGSFIACACYHRNYIAMTLFEKLYLSPLLLRIRGKEHLTSEMDDIKQTLWERFFHAEPPKEPKISQFAGLGDLQSWVRTAAYREVMGMLRKQKKETWVEDVLWNLPNEQDNQEVQYLKVLYRTKFKEVMQECLQGLSPKERNILRYYYVEGWTAEKIGTLYQTHRTTVSRWLEKIQSKLLEQTKSLLVQELELSTTNVESLLVLIQSQLDVSLHRFL